MWPNEIGRDEFPKLMQHIFIENNSGYQQTKKQSRQLSAVTGYAVWYTVFQNLLKHQVAKFWFVCLFLLLFLVRPCLGWGAGMQHGVFDA